MLRISQHYCCAFRPLPIFRLLLGGSQLLPSTSHVLLPVLCLLVSAFCFCPSSYAQSSTATLSGTVEDQKGALIAGASIALINADQGSQRLATTNSEGSFVFPLLPPGRYSVTATREGFAPVEIKDVVLNVNDQVAIKIHLNIGTVSQTVEIVDGASLISESPAVGTVVDRQFVANLPLNGRSFQTLITLSPGVVLTRTDNQNQGQFSINGQRANANYFTVDGVSANIAATASTFSQTAGGTLPGLSADGTTNNLVSVEALQEFKIQTSSYAPEFGRTPGGQISIVTRSGTNNFHGSLFEYFRNDALDATDWFANANRLRKPALRQNDFGGVLGGPLYLPRFGEGEPWFYGGKNRTFFFFSYEGLRLRQPQVASISVPTISVRQAAAVALRPFMNAYPLPNGQELGRGVARFSASYSNPSELNATSLRLDHILNSKLTVFGRYNYAPSLATLRRAPLSNLADIKSKIKTLTLGATQILNPQISNEARANYSRSLGGSFLRVDAFGGAVPPLDSQIFPPFVSSNEGFLLLIANPAPSFSFGKNGDNIQRQLNLIDNLSITNGSHQRKIGVDYRYLSPIFGIRPYDQVVFFSRLIGNPGAPPPAVSILSGKALTVTVNSRDPLALKFKNLSLYGQDSWKATPRLTLTYGLRWEVNPPPTGKNGKDLFTVSGLDTPSSIALAPRGTPLWKTTYNNFAPRVGIAYQLFQKPGRETVLRGGLGIFYDLGTGASGENAVNFPYIRSKDFFSLQGIPYPLDPISAAPPPFTLTPSFAQVLVFDPNIKLPRTYQWNVALEQSLGSNQTISMSYVAALGRRLLRQELIADPNPSFSSVLVTRNLASSDYHAMQLQFQRRLARGLQALTSYTWSHSIDNASSDTSAGIPGAALDPQLDRGPSDFDVRHAVVGALTYNIPAPNNRSAVRSLVQDFSIDIVFRAQTASPANVITGDPSGAAFGIFGVVRPDVVSGAPLYLDDPLTPGGRRFNPAAFAVPQPNRQGTLGRNGLRGFSLSQLDMAVRRQFNLSDRTNFQLRLEAFNLLNHPNFGNPISNLSDPQFGRSTAMLGSSLGNGGLSGGLNPLYQVGGARSLQIALKVQF